MCQACQAVVVLQLGDRCGGRKRGLKLQIEGVTFHGPESQLADEDLNVAEKEGFMDKIQNLKSCPPMNGCAKITFAEVQEEGQRGWARSDEVFGGRENGCATIGDPWRFC